MKAYTKYIENVEGYTDVYLTVTTTQKIAGAALAAEMKKLPNLVEHTNYLSKILEKYKKIYGFTSPIIAKNGSGGKLLVVIAGDRGLCGDLYPRIAKLANLHEEGYSEKILVGKAGAKYLEEEGVKPTSIFDATQFNELFSYLFQKFANEYKSIDVIYTEPKTLVSIEPVFVNILSVIPVVQNEQIAETSGLPILASKEIEMVQVLVRELLLTSLYATSLKAAISELSARTVAMESAASKTQEIIRKLGLDYFKDRRIFTTEKQLESFLVLKRT